MTWPWLASWRTAAEPTGACAWPLTRARSRSYACWRPSRVDAAGADGGPCERRGACGFNPIWCNAEAMLRSFFGSVTLWQVVEEGCVPRFTGGFELLRPQEGGAVPGAAGAPDEKDSHA